MQPRHSCLHSQKKISDWRAKKGIRPKRKANQHHESVEVSFNHFVVLRADNYLTRSSRQLFHPYSSLYESLVRFVQPIFCCCLFSIQDRPDTIIKVELRQFIPTSAGWGSRWQNTRSLWFATVWSPSSFRAWLSAWHSMDQEHWQIMSKIISGHLLVDCPLVLLLFLLQ